MNKIINGKQIAKQIQQDIIQHTHTHTHKPHLAIILIGENPASHTYVKNKIKACSTVNFQTTLIKHKKTTENKLIETIKQLNKNKQINGIIVQLPLPTNINKQKIINTIDPIKDVDCLHPLNYGKLISTNNPNYIPATPLGILTLLEKYNIQTQGKHCVIIGRSTIVGRPLSILMNQPKYNATVTTCHSHTKNLTTLTKQADILISATGIPKLIKQHMVKHNTVAIDVGITRITNKTTKTGFKLCGDIDLENIIEKCKYITPVPGGVGPMTIASLLKNTLKAFQIQIKA